MARTNINLNLEQRYLDYHKHCCLCLNISQENRITRLIIEDIENLENIQLILSKNIFSSCKDKKLTEWL